MINKCPKCQEEILPEANYCVNCGLNIEGYNNQNYLKDEISTSINNNNVSIDNYEIRRPNQLNPVNEINCPNCNNKLPENNLEYACSKCNIQFKREDNLLKLVNAKENTRYYYKFRNKKYSYDEWIKIFNNQLSQDEIANRMRYDNIMPTNIACPVCNNQLNSFNKSGLLSHKSMLICDNCNLTLEKSGDKYKLLDIFNDYSNIWNYYGQKLSLDEINRIQNGGLSDKEEKKRYAEEQKRLKEEEKIRQIQLKEEQKQRDMESLAEFKNSLSTQNPLLPLIADTTYILKKNERPLLKLTNITLREPRAVRTSTGGYGGMSVRVAKGVTLHSGRTRGRSVSHDEIKDIARGELLVTNKRIMFLGDNKTVNIDINKIISIESYKNGVKIQRSNKQKPEYFVGIENNKITPSNNNNLSIKMEKDMFKQLILAQLE